MKDVFDFVIHDANVRQIVFTAFWSGKLSDHFPEEVSDTFRALASSGKDIYVTDDVPFFPFEPSSCKFATFLRPINCATPADQVQAFRAAFMPPLEIATSGLTNVTMLHTNGYFCDNIACEMARDGTLFYRDPNHLNIEGSRYLARRLLESYPSLRDPRPNAGPPDGRVFRP